MAAAAAGYDYPALLEKIVELAIERQPDELAHARALRRAVRRGRTRRARGSSRAR